MKNNCSHKAIVKVKNIVISGTGFWNPGDDFVRDGVIKILENLFRGYQLNFLFYNFNQDFFPQSKFSGITNMAAKGDLNQYSEHVDAAVIAGLSAGLEINDLYNWIIDSNLLDRVYLIGAGYENEYVDKHISQEPAATIFKNARIITGRTRKKPKFISDYNLPYHHVNCPAILSVPNVKDVSHGKRIEKIAFSIQLPHQIGIMNQSCAESMHKLALNIFFELSSEYEIEVVAHHKSEYFYFVKLFHKLGLSVPVIFSSFYQDMFNIYRRYDLIIGTRLHSCLFGNGHGIPGIVLNDTDRHTHCLEGFPHSIWVNSKNRFDSAFREIQKWNYTQVAEDAVKFKESLLNQYLNVLAEPFGLNIEEMNTREDARQSENLRVLSTGKRKDQDNYGVGKPQSVSDENGGTSNDSFARDLTKRLIDTISGDIDTKRRVLNIFNRLTKDHWLQKNIEAYRRLIQNRVLCFDAASFLNWYAKYFRPRYYLEVGVRRGRSLAQVLSQSPATTAFGFDMWIPDYGSKPLDGILTSNPGPEFVRQELRNIGSDNLPTLIKGNSHQTLPKFWSDNQNPQQIDLIFVDGDHTYAGAKLDLDICLRHLSDGGALVFDDISHPSHPELEQLWKETKIRYPDCIYIEHSSGVGTGVAFKPPFDNLKRFLSKDICFLSAKNAGKIENKGVVDKSANANLPVHFFTIVLNGEPFIRYHIDIFKRLSFKWHWHIIEGVAELKHDTAWSLQNGGCISDELHRCGLSNDGTTKYLDEIEREYPENITIYRKPEGMFWSGKLEMVNAPFENINEECLLWQVDADELWTIEQICKGRVMFMAEPDRTAAYYLDHFFVGEGLTITTIDTYGNNTTYEWLRTWRFKPSFRWTTHEPPRLCMPTQDGQWIDISTINPFKHNETEANGMVFQHYAYATERQLRFKEIYYGYKNGVEGWRSLQMQSNFPVFLREYFPWVKDAAQVDTIASQNIKPLASRDNSDQWQFSLYGAVSEQQPTPSPDNCKEILFIRTDSIGDNILAMAMLPHIKDKYPKANITTLCQEHIADLYEACPFVGDIVTFDRQRSYEDEEYRSSITQQLQAINADITLNSVYSREPLTDVFAIGSGAKERIAFNGNLCNISAKMRDKHNHFYSRLLPSGEEYKQELERNRDFLKGLGIGAPPLQPIMWTTHEDEQFAQKLFKHNNINPENTIALFPSAQHHHKIYQHYQLVLQHFQDFDLVVLGGKDAMVQADKICEKFRGNCVNLTGKTTICQMASVIRRCRIYIGSDSAGAHVACAVGVPNVVLLGGGHFNRFLPYSALTSVVCLPLECYRCNWQCPFQKAHCISDIAPDVIIEAIRLTLEHTSENPRIVVQKNSLWNPQEGQPKWTTLGQYLGLANVEIISVGAEPYSIDVNDLNMQGENLFAKGDLSGALNIFTKALDLVPENALTHNNLGVLYYNLGERKIALNHYKKATELQPEKITFQKNLADFYYVEQDRVEEAMRIYVKVLKENPEDIETLLALAHICVTLKKFDDAKYFSSRILLIESGNKDAIKFLEKLEECQLAVAGGQKNQANIEAGSDEYLVSAIVSAYNSERFLRGCLEDLENQTIADKIEIIVVDSGSEQNEEVIVQEFQKKYQNIKCIKTKQRETLYESWNRGIKVASGKYITNANTDDRHRKDAFEILAGALDRNPTAALAYGDCLITENENETFEHNTANRCYIFPEFSKRQMLARQFFGPQPMWRKSVHEKIGYFNSEYVVCGDWDFFIRLGTEFDAIHTPEFLGLYCRRDDSVERSNKDRNKNEQREIYGKYRNTRLIEEIYPNLDRQNIDNDAYAAAYADLGNIFMMSSMDLDSARKAFEKGLEYKNYSIELLNNLALSFLFEELMGEAQMVIDSIKDNPDHKKKLRKIMHNFSNKRLIPEEYALMSISHPFLNDLPPVRTGSLEHSLEEGKKIQDQQKIYSNYTALNKFESAIAEFKDNNFRDSERLIEEYKYLVNYNLFRKTDNRKRELPRISVIIVSYSKNGELLECINSFEKQSINGFEIIIVDNGNNSKVECALKEKKILYIKSPRNFFPAEGRNIGVSFARGEIIAFLDDDATVHDNYINSIRKAFETYKICGFRGKIIPKSESIYNKNARHYNLGDIPIPNSIDIEGNSAFLKDVYLEMNGMNPILYGSEGLEFSYRISKKYGVFATIYWPETIIYHDFAADVAKYQNKLMRHDFSKKYLLDKYPDIYNYYNFLNSYSQNSELANKGESLLNRV